MTRKRVRKDDLVAEPPPAPRREISDEARAYVAGWPPIDEETAEKIAILLTRSKRRCS